MNNLNKIKFITKTLDELFPAPKVPLNYKDAYTLLVAVVLSAQCTDNRVNMVTAKLFEYASTPKDMVNFGIANIENIIKPCGLFKTKSANIFNLSKILVEKFKSNVPSSFKELELLPGVGHKTASVIMSHIFKKPAFPVDTHIFRLAKRWGLSSGKNVNEVEADLKKMFKKNDWERKHLQIIFFGRTYCKALGHKIESCPICSVINKL